MSVFLLLIFFSFLIPWLLICGALSILGLLLPFKSISLETSDVEMEKTVCKILNEKKILSDEDYTFETYFVAKEYDQFTFKGYAFIFAPILKVLENSKLIDNGLYYLVQKWIQVHKFWIFNNSKPKLILRTITSVCVTIAWSLGKFLTLFHSQNNSLSEGAIHE